MPIYERGPVRIRYEETGAGFPLLVRPKKLARRGVRARSSGSVDTVTEY
jgi:hypothetical protein